MCSAGRFSVGGRNSCDHCPVGRFQRLLGESQCNLAEPGFFVNNTGRAYQAECPPGTSSPGGDVASCTPCDVGFFNPNKGASSCTSCPAPMTTTGNGRTYCDACIRSYFWNPLYWDDEGSAEYEKDGDQCVDCCTRCEDICDIDDEDCVNCDDDGARLESLDVERGWWRATEQSLKVYKCPFDRACRGGKSTAGSDECYAGHIGALCGACSNGYDYDIGRNRCAHCTPVSKMIGRAGILFFILVVFALAILLCFRKFCIGLPFCTALSLALKDQARDDEVGINYLGEIEDALATVEEEEQKKNDAAPSTGPTRRRSIQTSVLTKLYVHLFILLRDPISPPAAKSSLPQCK